MTGNRIVDALSPEDVYRLRPFLARRQFAQKEVLDAQGSASSSTLFPVTAVVAVIATQPEGPGIELTSIGNEGMIGARTTHGQRYMPPRWHCEVQIPGEMLVMEQSKFEHLLPGLESFRSILPTYLEILLQQLGQQVICNASHSVEERCCRWLLLTSDRNRASKFSVTHEYLANMLGVRRASVSLAACSLQNAGLIRYCRGQIEILDRSALEEVACECYHVLRAEFDRALDPSSERRTTP